jgi:hypothetical protein
MLVRCINTPVNRKQLGGRGLIAGIPGECCAVMKLHAAG